MGLILWQANCGSLLAMLTILWIALRSPYLSRRDLFFAVTVQPDFPDGPIGLQIYRRYRRVLLLASGVAFFLVALGDYRFLVAKNRETVFFATLVLPSILAVGLQLGSFVLAHRQARKKVLPHAAEPSSIRESPLLVSESRQGTKALALFRIVPWIVLLSAGLYLWSNWESIPERFPIHWGVSGQADGWAHKSFYGVFGVLLMGAATVLLLEVIMVFLTIGMPRRAPEGGGRNAGLHGTVQATRWLVAFIGLFIAMIFSFLGCYIPLHAKGDDMPAPMLLAIVFGDFLLLVGIGITIAWMMQKKEKMRKAQARNSGEQSADGTAPLGDHTDDRHWKLGGCFYYNPDDPAIWVEKRIGFGWTTNMARKESWLILGGMCAALGIFVAVLIWMGMQGRCR